MAKTFTPSRETTEGYSKRITLYRGGVTNTKKYETVTAQFVIQEIAACKNESDIRLIRAQTDKKKQNELKARLDVICWSGIFTNRNAKSLKEHSGLICLDFDGLGTLEQVGAQIEKICQSPYLLVAFRSPSGTGFKAVFTVAIAADKGYLHESYFLALEDYVFVKFGLTADKSGKDVCRACFMSSDSSLFYRESTEKEFSIVESENPNDNHIYWVDEQSGELITVGPKITQEAKDNLERQAPSTSAPVSDLKDPFNYATLITERITSHRLNICETYDQWLKVSSACASLGEAGRDLFHKLSSLSSKYKYEENNKRFNQSLKEGKQDSFAYVVAQAKANGVSTQWPRGSAQKTRSKVKDEQANRATTDEDIAQDAKPWLTINYATPQGLFLDENQKRAIYFTGLFQWKNKMYYARFNDETCSLIRISNFAIKPLYHISNSTNTSIRIFEITNIAKATKLVSFSAKSLSSTTTFSELVLERGNFDFTGSKIQFEKVRSFILANSKEATEIETLGYYPKRNFYVFANGICYKDAFYPVNEYGIVEIEIEGKSEYYFIAAFSNIYSENSDEHETERKIRFCNSPLNFENWANTILEMHGIEHGSVAILYYLSSVFRDIIFRSRRCFPHLFCFGPPMSGKSALATNIRLAFMDFTPGFSLFSGTKVGFVRMFDILRNGIVHFDEYKNDIELARVQILKNAYDGIGHTKGVFSAGSEASKRTTASSITAGCIISGQELPVQDNALFTRTILLEFTSGEHDLEAKRKFNDYVELSNKHGNFTNITAEVFKYRDLFATKFEENYKQAASTLSKQCKGEKIEDRIIQNYAILLASYLTLETELKLPFNSEKLNSILTERLLEQFRKIASTKEVSQWWTMFQFLVAKKILSHGTDYEIRAEIQATVHSKDGHKVIREFEQPKDVLYVNFSRTHNEYLTNSRQQTGNVGMDKVTLIHYITHTPEYIGYVRSRRFERGNNTSAYAFDYNALYERYDLNIEADGYEENDEDQGPKAHKPVPAVF